MTSQKDPVRMRERQINILIALDGLMCVVDDLLKTVDYQKDHAISTNEAELQFEIAEALDRFYFKTGWKYHQREVIE